MFVFRCGEAPVVYAKQMLHADEQPYFHPGERPRGASIPATGITLPSRSTAG